MREVEIESLGTEAARLLDGVERDSILLTRSGKPYAVILSTGEYDAEDWGYMTDPEFWRMIQDSRKDTEFVTLEEVEAKLRADEAAEAAEAAAQGLARQPAPAK